jgi:hypothetical protein
VTDLSDLVEPLKRLVATPGTFATFYPNTTDEDLTGSIMDGFAECQLDGFFNGPDIAYVLDLDAGTVTPDIPNAGRALVQIYAAANFVTDMVINLKNQVRYEAKGTVYETIQAASILTALLKQFQDRKAAIIALLRQESMYAAFHMADAYVIRATTTYPVGGVGLLDAGLSIGAVGSIDPYGF